MTDARDLPEVSADRARATTSTAELSPAKILAIGALATFALRLLARPHVPDDYDSINFLFGMSRGYDLALFQPQFPGYPVFVALGAALHGVGLSVLLSAELVSAAASGLSAAALGWLAWRFAGKGAALAALALHAVAWLPWLLGSGALSDALGTAFALLAFAASAEGRGVGDDRRTQRFLALAGAAMGLALGVRLSYWPLAISLGALAMWSAESSRRWRRAAPVAVGLGIGLAAWGIPFVAWIGPRQLLALGKTHVTGHFEQWGGTIVTRPNVLLRLAAMIRGTFYDGIAPWPPAVIGLALVVGLVLWRTPRAEWPRPSMAVALALGPYALWAFVAQNVVEQPRHVLPLAVAALLGFACLLGRRPAATALAVALVAAASVPLAVRRLETPPAAKQLVDWVLANPADPDQLEWVAGTRSIRFFQDFAPEVTTRQAQWLSQLAAELVRVNRFPDRMLITSEVDMHSGMGEHARLPHNWRSTPFGPEFCRDARIDRAQPCLQLSQLTWVP